MVVAYNPKSKYASQFKAIADGSKPVSDLFTLLQTPGLKLGRTDPNIDPQGRDFIYMLQLAQMYYHLPSDTVSKILGTTDWGTANSPQIYAESALDSTLQSGQLDAPASRRVAEVVGYLGFVPSGDKVAGIHPERVLAGAFPDRGLVLTGVVAACRPAGAGWEADLRVGEATITCRLPDMPPATDREFAVTALGPPYFGSDGSGLPARAAESDAAAPQQVHR